MKNPSPWIGAIRTAALGYGHLTGRICGNPEFLRLAEVPQLKAEARVNHNCGCPQCLAPAQLQREAPEAGLGMAKLWPLSRFSRRSILDVDKEGICSDPFCVGSLLPQRPPNSLTRGQELEHPRRRVLLRFLGAGLGSIGAQKALTVEPVHTPLVSLV